MNARVQLLARDVQAEARALVALYAERIDAASRLAALADPTLADVELVLDAGRRLDEQREVFRRRHFPRRAEVLVAGYAVYVCSATRRNVETLLDLHHEYVLPEVGALADVAETG